MVNLFDPCDVKCPQKYLDLAFFNLRLDRKAPSYWVRLPMDCACWVFLEQSPQSHKNHLGLDPLLGFCRRQ